MKYRPLQYAEALYDACKDTSEAEQKKIVKNLPQSVFICIYESICFELKVKFCLAVCVQCKMARLLLYYRVTVNRRHFQMTILRKTQNI